MQVWESKEVWGWWESILVSKCPLKAFLSVLSSALKSARTSDNFNVSHGSLLVSILNIPIVFINRYYGSICIVLLPLLPVCWQYTQYTHSLHGWGSPHLLWEDLVMFLFPKLLFLGTITQQDISAVGQVWPGLLGVSLGCHHLWFLSLKAALNGLTLGIL